MSYPFNPNYVLSNRHIYGYDAQFDIDAFLETWKSPLRDYRTKDNQTFTELLSDICREENINPRFMLATLQKEQSLITKAGDQKAMDWALGFGAHDDGTRKEEFRGFEKQLQAAAKRLNYYAINYKDRIKASVRVDVPLTDKYGKRSVYPVNIATVACYAYTPHIGDRVWGRYKPPYGNLLLHRIWTRFYGNPH